MPDRDNLWYADLGLGDLEQVGGKNADLEGDTGAAYAELAGDKVELSLPCGPPPRRRTCRTRLFAGHQEIFLNVRGHRRGELVSAATRAARFQRSGSA